MTTRENTISVQRFEDHRGYGFEAILSDGNPYRMVIAPNVTEDAAKKESERMFALQDRRLRQSGSLL